MSNRKKALAGSCGGGEEASHVTVIKKEIMGPDQERLEVDSSGARLASCGGEVRGS